jgi:CRISPR-associated endonuclease/helicase Cas3
VTKLRRQGEGDIPALPWQDCFAKSTEQGGPGLSVLEHSRNVGEVARALLGVLPTRVLRLLGSNPAGAAALHDVGKVSPGFQLKYFSASVRSRLPELGAHAIENYCTKHACISEAALNAFLTDNLGATPVGAVVGSHHGMRDDPGRDDSGVYGGLAWARERRALIEHLCNEFGPLAEGTEIDPEVLTGMVCVADWIGSDERFFPNVGRSLEVDLAAQARKAVVECGWLQTWLKQGLSFREAFGFPPHSLQQEFIDSVDGPGLYVLEAPMGSGKTEAALYAAYRLMTAGANEGLYFALPTRLTSDRIHERVHAFLQKVAEGGAAVRLAHGYAWLRAFEHGGEALAPGNEWFSPRKRALLMPFAVGTIDQALLSVVKVKHFFVRSFGLAGKVVVLDEVHSYDLYTGTLLDLLVRKLLATGCTVIVLSATLTAVRRRSLLTRPEPIDGPDSYPQVSIETPSAARKLPLTGTAAIDIEIRLRDSTASQVADEAVLRASRGQCVLCIASTVATAQRWYNEVKAVMPEGAFDVGLLHSKFPGWRREELESLWTAALGKSGPRPHGCVLVATQVVEQSVDLDADFMISELAPTDMLLQRLGRLWRHPREARPCGKAELIVVARDLDAVGSLAELVAALGKPNCFVYAPFVLWRTFQVWKGIGRLRVPDDISALLERTYSESSEPPPEFAEEARLKLEARKEGLRALANAARADVLGFPTMTDEEGVATRYSDIPMVDAALARSVLSTGSAATVVLSDGTVLKLDADLWVPPYAKALFRNLVPVPTYRVPAAKRPRFLRKYFYDKRTPILVIDDSGEVRCDGRPTVLRYDNERGLQAALAPAVPGRQGNADIDYDEGASDEFDS